MDILFIVNTHSSYHDVFDLFYKQFRRHCSRSRLAVFTDKVMTLEARDYVIRYDPCLDFRSQYLSCLETIEDPFCITLNDDYFLTGAPNWVILERLYYDLRANSAYSFIRLLRGHNFSDATMGGSSDLFHCDPLVDFVFSQVATLWRTRRLEFVYSAVLPSGIARKGKELQAEVLADHFCRLHGIKGGSYFAGEPKRGHSHYDSSVLPHVASAVVDGKWNLKEYQNELIPLFRESGLDMHLRGAL